MSLSQHEVQKEDTMNKLMIFFSLVSLTAFASSHQSKAAKSAPNSPATVHVSTVSADSPTPAASEAPTPMKAKKAAIHHKKRQGNRL